jgi:hypothetical protein
LILGDTRQVFYKPVSMGWADRGGVAAVKQDEMHIANVERSV